MTVLTGSGNGAGSGTTTGAGAALYKEAGSTASTRTAIMTKGKIRNLRLGYDTFYVTVGQEQEI